MPLLPPPTGFSYSSGTLSWTGVPGVDEYQIEFQTSAPHSPWIVCYNGGNATSCTFNQPVGTYKVKGKSKESGGGWGVYGTPETVIVA